MDIAEEGGALMGGRLLAKDGEYFEHPREAPQVSILARQCSILCMQYLGKFIDN